MDGLVYAGAILGLAVIAAIAPRVDRWSAALVGTLLVLFSGLRSSGFDYEEYLTMIAAVRASATPGAVDFMAAAKDPFFGLVVYAAERLRADDAWVLLAMCAAAGLTKVGFALYLSSGRTLFLALYALLLAPGLEFAALRASVGIGFLLLAVISSESVARRAVFWGLTVLSHLSLTITAIFALWKVKLTGRNVALAALMVAGATYVVMSGTLELFPFVERLDEYRENRGTQFALLLPVATLAVLWLGTRVDVIKAAAEEDASLGMAFRIALGMAAAALGVALPMVTVSTRVLEVSWVFTLYVLTRLATVHGSTRARLGILGFVALMAAVNLGRGTWAAMADLGVLAGW